MASYLLKQARQASAQSGSTTAAGSKDHYLSWMLGTRNLPDLLHHAVLKKRAQMLWLLLSHGANPLGKDSNGKTLLDLAKTVDDNAEVISILTRCVCVCVCMFVCVCGGRGVNFLSFCFRYRTL